MTKYRSQGPQHPQQDIQSQSLLTVSDSRASDTEAIYAGSNTGWSPAAQSFWLKAARGLDWFIPPAVVSACFCLYAISQFDLSVLHKAYGPSLAQGKDSWFPNATLNICYEALDRHCIPVAANKNPGNRPCLHHVSVMPEASLKPSETWTYDEVLENVKVLSGVLRYTLGVQKGDTVIIYSV